MKTFALLLAFAVAAQAAQLPIKAAHPALRRIADEGKIVGGTPATLGQFPHQVSMSIATPQGNFFCGGNLISTNWVLTAAHCCDGATSITVGLGSLSNNGAGGQSITVPQSGIMGHASYNPNTLRNDVCLLSLPTPATVNANVRPIALQPSTAGDLAGNRMTISGWGKTSDVGGVSSVLNWAQVNAITNTQCQATFGALVVTTGTICIDTTAGSGTCNGDSGGPLVDNASGLLSGVTSFGSSAGCTQGYPTGFSRVSAFNDWVTGITGPL